MHTALEGRAGHTIRAGQTVKYTFLSHEDGRRSAGSVRIVKRKGIDTGGLGIPLLKLSAVMAGVWYFCKANGPQKIADALSGMIDSLADRRLNVVFLP